jgi:hypothetical protein
MIDGRRMPLLREWPQVLLLLAGLASFALGDWLVAVQAGALVNQAQGTCDFISCVNSTTVPELITGVVLVLIGTATGLILIRGQRGDRYGGV